MLNIFLLSTTKDSESDKIYLLGKYTYKETWNRMLLLEKITGKEQLGIRKIFRTIRKKYEESGKIHTKKHSQFIEVLIENELINHAGDNWTYFWKNSSFFTKLHFFYMLLLPASFFVGTEIVFALDPSTGELLSEMPFDFYIALPALILFVILFAVIMIIFNIVCYQVAKSILEFFKIESGVLNKNIAAIESVTDSIKFYKNSTIILFTGGLIGSTAVSKIRAFKGLGGGKFGGGGAGGNW